MYEWQLDDLYSAYDSQEFIRDWKKLEDFKLRLEALDLADNKEAIKEIIRMKEEFTIISRKIGSFISLNLSTNTSDSTHTNFRARYGQIISNLTKIMTRIDLFLGNIKTDLSQDDYLADYSFALQELANKAQHTLSEDLEEVIAKLDISAGHAWSNLHTFLTSRVEEEIDGQTYTLSEIRNLAYEADGDVRKKAYEAELAMYDKIKDPIAFSLNNIKKQVNTITDLKGYSKPIERTLEQSRMKHSTLLSLMTAIEKYLPEFRRYLRLKAEYLGHNNGLPFYDLFAPVGKTSKKFTVEESGHYLIEHFSSFSKDLADLVQKAYDNKYIDFLPKKGKRGGAFCSNLPFINQSRILTNFDGSLSSVITLAHELGHAYHGSIIQDHKPLNWSYSMPVAETASTFNETIIMDELIKASTNQQEKLALVESLLQDTTQIIVDIYSRYYFENKVFEEVTDKFLFSEQLEAIMKEAQLAAYGDGLDPDYLHPFMWVNKGHYYSAGLSFYNFPYAYGGLFARGLYSLYQEESEGFVDKYNQLLYSTTISSVEDTAKVMGIDVEDPSFWEKSLDSFVYYIDLFEEMTKNNI